MTYWNGSLVHVQARTRRFTDTFGFFCDIALELSALDAEERRLDGAIIPPHLRGAVTFGIDYALGKLGYFTGWKAKIDRFEHHTVDTTPEVVALTTAQAVLQALGHDEQPVLDVDRGIVVFPK